MDWYFYFNQLTMARPERNNVDYFPHFMNHAGKMSYLRNKYGNDGYACWYLLMERLAASNNHHIDLRDEIKITFLADYCGVSESILMEIILFLVKAKWLHSGLWESKIIYSEDFTLSISDVYKRRNTECINSQALVLMYHNNPQEEELLLDSNPQSKLEYSKPKESKPKETKGVKSFSKDVHDCFDSCMNYFPENLRAQKEKEKISALETIEKLNRIDKIPFDHIERIVEGIRKDDFWAKNFLSMAKLRKKNKDDIQYVIVFNEYLKGKENGKSKFAEMAEYVLRKEGLVR